MPLLLLHVFAVAIVSFIRVLVVGRNSCTPFATATTTILIVIVNGQLSLIITTELASPVVVTEHF